MSDFNPTRPATLQDIYTALETVTRGVGIITALAVKHGAPANLDAFVNAVQLAELEFTKTEPDIATFFEVAYSGIETVLYDMEEAEDTDPLI